MANYLSFLRCVPIGFFNIAGVQWPHFVGQIEMRGNLVLAFILCFVATTGFAQSRLNGKWEADRSANSQSSTATSRNQSVQLDLAVDGDTASGSLSLGGLGGTFYVFQNSKVTGNRVQFRPDSNPSLPIWTIELVDDNTVTLSRGSLPLVGSNVLDLLAVLGNMPQQVPVASPTMAAVSAATSVQDATAGSIQGSTRDVSNALIPGVTMTITSVDTGLKRTSTTNDVGRYSFSALPPGTYTLTATLSGFAPTVVSNLRVSDAELRQDMTLELPATPASVNPASCNANGIAWCSVLHRTR